VNKRLPITPGRLLVLIVGLPLALLLIGGLAITEVAHAGQGTYRVRLNVPVRGHSVEISLDSGDLHVRQATTARLRISGTALYSLVRSTVTPLTARSGVTVVSSCHFVTFVCSFDYHVGLPAGTAETFSDGQGDITVTGITNPTVTASDRAGNVTLTFTKVPDRVEVTDAFGNVKIVLPVGLTVYHVITQAQFGKSSIGVPTSPQSKHLINVTDASGSISVTN
jgi:hypothetical protein